MIARYKAKLQQYRSNHSPSSKNQTQSTQQPSGYLFETPTDFQKKIMARKDSFSRRSNDSAKRKTPSDETFETFQKRTATEEAENDSYAKDLDAILARNKAHY